MRKTKLVTQTEENFRKKRFQLLEQLLNTLPRPIRILDVGGAMGFWEILDYSRLGEIQVTMVNRFPQDNLPPNFSAIIGDACDLKQWNPQDFDVVLSNSVIGHVGSFANQTAMANEIRRVGRRYFVQTPNHYFPVDWRTLTPFFHFLPVKLRAWLLYRFPIAPFGRLPSYARALEWTMSVRNLTRKEMKTLFPEATLVDEKAFGLTKSFMVYHGFDLT